MTSNLTQLLASITDKLSTLVNTIKSYVDKRGVKTLVEEVVTIAAHDSVEYDLAALIGIADASKYTPKNTRWTARSVDTDSNSVTFELWINAPAVKMAISDSGLFTAFNTTAQPVTVFLSVLASPELV